MKKYLHLLIIILILASSVAFPKPASACSCPMPGTPLQEFAQADAVFIGKVIQISNNVGQLIQNYLAQYISFVPYSFGTTNYAFFVSQSWKGVTNNTIAMQASSSSGSCGYTFTKANDYVVYAFRYKSGYITSTCTRTSEVLYAATDMVYLSGLPLLQLKNTYHPFVPSYICMGITLGLALLLLGFIQYRRKKQAFSIE